MLKLFGRRVWSCGDRLVDILKIVLTQTTFRFSVEHRLPKAIRLVVLPLGMFRTFH